MIQITLRTGNEGGGSAEAGEGPPQPAEDRNGDDIKYILYMFIVENFEAIATAGAAPSFQPRELQKNEAERLKRLGRAQNRTFTRAPPPGRRRGAGGRV